MNVALKRRAVALAAAITVMTGAWSGTAASAGVARPRRIVIVSVPGVTWADVDAGWVPTLASLADRWAVAAMSVRTAGPVTDAASAYASLGAGNRARGLGGDGRLVTPETVDAPGGGLRVRGMQAVQQDNGHLRFGAVPGTLGSVLHQAGLRTAVVGNADGGEPLPHAADAADAAGGPRVAARAGRATERRRYAGLALADRSGRVDAGEVGSSLVVADPSTSNGWRADPDAVAAAARGVIGSADVILVEVADAYREAQAAAGELGDPNSPPLRVDDPRRMAALRRDDALVGRIAREMDLAADTLLVLAPSGPGPRGREHLTVALLAGVGSVRRGWLTSPTTRRSGIVALTDVGPGILRLLDLPEPEMMAGSAFHAVAGPPHALWAARREQLFRVDAAAEFHLRWVNRFFVLSVVLQLVLYLFAWRRLPWGSRSMASVPEATVRSRAGAVRALTLAFMALPLATLVLRALGAELWGPWGPVAVLAATCALMAAAAVRGPWKRWASGPPAFVCAVTAAVIVADLLTGGHVQMSSLIGYSPIVAGRFFGAGNLVFAVLGTSAMLVTAAVAARRPRGGVATVVAVGLVVVAAESGPAFGADFGGLLALVPAFGVLAVLVSGRRVSWRKILMLGLAAAAVAFAVGVADALRPPEVQTHIGRFFSRLLGEGPGAVTTILGRKAAANWALLAHSALTLSVPVALAFV
ncbi:MAG TPA: hypothetical protein VII47_08065, partial [Actinomycetota bacterium]